MAAAPGLLLGPLRPLRPLPLPLLLLLLLLGAPGSEGSAGRGRRFSELKVCADDECSSEWARRGAGGGGLGPKNTGARPVGLLSHLLPRFRAPGSTEMGDVGVGLEMGVPPTPPRGRF